MKNIGFDSKKVFNSELGDNIWWEYETCLNLNINSFAYSLKCFWKHCIIQDVVYNACIYARHSQTKCKSSKQVIQL